jgi:hypothetical protein
MLARFDVLLGTWTTESTHPQIDEVVPGIATFEWLEGGRFLIQHSHNDHELLPDAISVIGPPETGDGLVIEYFDSRGVRRTYESSTPAPQSRKHRKDEKRPRQLTGRRWSGKSIARGRVPSDEEKTSGACLPKVRRRRRL